MYRRYCALLEQTTPSSKNAVKQKKRKPKQKKIPKIISKDAKYLMSTFVTKLKKYGEKRKALRSWQKDLLMTWREKARKRLEEKNKKAEEEKEKEEEEATEEEINQGIHVKSVDLHVDDNAKLHHTDRYFATDPENEKGEKKKQELVVRRGQEFKLTLFCDRKYDKDIYDMKIVFEIGYNPSLVKETRAVIKIDESGVKPENTDEWNARLEEKTSGNEVTLLILPPNDCIIGEWTMHVITYVPKDNGEVSLELDYEYPEDITILLNPWCEDDSCYMPCIDDYDPREEYVLADTGYVYQGSSRRIYEKRWRFGQFDKGILHVALVLLRKVFKYNISTKMADPVFISRAIAQVVNACDEDEGVLVGNWSGNYEGGCTPSVWTGSVKILRQYAENLASVKFGQCWVFSAVTVTVCRALGLPCRSVTNFSSAHDTDGTTCIEWVYTPDKYNKMKKLSTGDSIWNFHVWNEVWMDRPDLPPGYDGWQVIDATPQERSDGVYTCGPASVAAIKEGNCVLPFDTAFVFAEVNADIRKWKLVGNFAYESVGVVTNSVGKNISTKQVAKDRREDVTNHYKHKEGSKEERTAAAKAGKDVESIYETNKAQPKDLQIELKDIQDVMIGQDANVELEVKNISDEKETRSMSNLNVDMYCCDYTGTVTNENPVLSDSHGGSSFAYDGVEKFKTKLRFEKYWDYIQEGGTILVVATLKCNETQREHLLSDTFRISRPDLVVKCPETCKKGDHVEVQISFKNPVPIQLNECKLHIDASQFEIEDEDDPEEIQLGTIEPNGECNKVVKLKALKKGYYSYIMVNFDSKDLHDIIGSAPCKVED